MEWDLNKDKSYNQLFSVLVLLHGEITQVNIPRMIVWLGIGSSRSW